MSLINDALTRAKQVPPAQPPPLPLRPAEPAPKSGDGFAWMIGLGALLLVLLIAGGLLAALRFTQVKARQADSRDAASTLPATPPAPEPVPVPVVAAPAPAPTEQLTAAPAPRPVLKLKAILFNPARPAADVNGRTVFVGEEVEGFTVTSITRSTCTLVSSTETNVLELKY